MVSMVISQKRLIENGPYGVNNMVDKLGNNTTHSIPRRISSDTGNKNYLLMQGLLERELSGGAITAILCATLALISEIEERTEIEEGSKFTYGDNQLSRELSPSLFYTVEKTNPSIESDKLSRYIDHTLIPTGFEVIRSHNAVELCDLIIQSLDS